MAALSVSLGLCGLRNERLDGGPRLHRHLIWIDILQRGCRGLKQFQRSWPVVFLPLQNFHDTPQRHDTFARKSPLRLSLKFANRFGRYIFEMEMIELTVTQQLEVFKF